MRSEPLLPRSAQHCHGKRRFTHGRALRYLLPVLAFAAIAGFLFLGLFRDPSTIPSPLIGKPAPAFALPLLAREAGTAADARLGAGSDAAANTGSGARLTSAMLGGRPYLLNVWASWCTPCLQEHPLLLELARRKLVTLVGIGYKDDPKQARTWLKRHGDPFNIVASDVDGRVAIDWGVYGVPETFVVDGHGTIRYKHVGPLNREVFDRELLPLLERLAQG